MSKLNVTKRSGQQEIYRAEMINKAIERACEGSLDIPNKVMKIITDFELTLFDGISTTELDRSLIIAASQNIKDDPEYDTIARNLLLLTIYKECIAGYEVHDTIADRHPRYFVDYIHQGIELGILTPELEEKFNLLELSQAIDTSRDNLFKFLGLSTIYDRYLIRDRSRRVIESPQAFWMRVSMGLSLNEADPTATAIRFYNHISQLEYVPATPTLFNSGTMHPQLSSCYIMNMYDEIEHIGKTVTDTMLLSKFAGGIGINVTNVRAIGSYISSINGKSSGVIPFLKIFDVTVKGISQGGKRRGSACFYMETWHYEFEEFIELRENSGDPYRRTYAANTAAWISDEFMHRVDRDKDWYYFDPAETPDLPELYGAAFSKRYQEYCDMADRGEMRMFRKTTARELFNKMLMKLQTTSHPWLTFKDAMNVRALTKNAGVIHSSNLCTEITLPNDRDNVAVCNLASINLSRFLEEGNINYERLEIAVRSAIRGLDNVIDINFYPIKETRHSNNQNRPVGLGLMGFTETTQLMGLAYDSKGAMRLMDEVMEFISYHAIAASAELAVEKGSYQNFPGSGWSEGKVPLDTIEWLEEERGHKLKVNKHFKLDWDGLRSKVKKGMRNANLLAIAPNATIGLISGTTPGLDPNFSNIFSRNTLSGKFLEFNPVLVAQLKELGVWEEVKDQIIINRGDISQIDEIPMEMKHLYQTSFQIDPEAFTDIAARAQKWVDQAISRNMYLETRDISQMREVYLNAWKKGLKSTYYLHMKQRHTAEQSTVKVNKRESMGRKGFAGFAAPKPTEPVVTGIDMPTDMNTDSYLEPNATLTATQTATAPTPAMPVASAVSVTSTTTATATQMTDKAVLEACPIDPAERALCESCQ